MKVEIRNEDGKESVMLSGYVNAIERKSKVLHSPQGKFVETVRAKTFQRALDKAENVYLLHNHDSNRVLGSTQEGNLSLHEDNIGLFAEARIYDEDMINKAKNDQLVGYSFGFSVVKDIWEEGDDGINQRYLEDINLKEVSILDNTKSPAYQGTQIMRIESRDNEDVLVEQRVIEDEVQTVDLTVKEEKREIDYSLYDKQIEILKLK